MNKLIYLEIITLALFLSACAALFHHLHQPKTVDDVDVRVLVLKGDKIIKTEDIGHSDGRFYFFITKKGVVYFDTTIGDWWQLQDERTLGEKHRQIVEDNWREVSKKWVQ